MLIKQLVSDYDPANQFKVLIDSYKQIETVWNNEPNLFNINPKEINAIIICGLGGSAIGGDLLLNFFRSELLVPVIVSRNYELPAFSDKSTLVIASSYSGNTEETISSLKDALRRNCRIVSITTGGEVEKISLMNNIPVVKLEKGYQPRYALWINFFTLINTLQILKFVPKQDKIVSEIINLLKNKGEELSQENNAAYSIAESLIGYIPIIYSVSDVTSAAGNRLKCQFNENSKLHAFQNVFPELNHNEIIGWETFDDKQLRLKLLLIDDGDYNSRIKKRIDITKEIIENAGVDVIRIESPQAELKLRIIDIVYLTDWITYYLAVLRGKDPTSIININYLKNRLAETEK